MIDDRTLHTIKSILFRHLDPQKDTVFIFGSWVTGRNGKYSDIDIGVVPHQPFSLTKRARIEQDLEESDLPYMVDLVDFNGVSEKFKAEAMKQQYALN